jgi:TolB protein
MRKILLVPYVLAALGGSVWLLAQDINVGVSKEAGNRPRIALPDLRGAGDAQTFMGAFNQTLQGDIRNSGFLTVVASSWYPKSVPQQVSDWRTPPLPVQAPRSRRGEMVTAPDGGGFWMTDWSRPPVSANYMAFGYTALQNGVLVLYGNLFDLTRPNTTDAQMISKRYLAPSNDDKGARDLAHQFAADILALFGAQSLAGTHIYYVHQASRMTPKEIWVMDFDGRNQRQITHFNSLTIQPSVSPDGAKIAFTSYTKGQPRIFVFSTDPVRDLRFYNQIASMNGQPSFTPDGKQIVYSSSAGVCCRIFIANMDGSGFQAVTSPGSIDAEPKVNPKTGQTILFSSGRSGPEQMYLMSLNGTDIERLSDGTGEASNPAWSPDGQHVAFAWTRGYAQGKFNVFIMDVGSRQYVQLTHDEGRNENPTFAPGGTHLAFMSTRNGREQIYSMLADGSGVQALTSQGYNYSPVWGK